MVSTPPATLKRDLAIVRDQACGRDRRALAVAKVAAAFNPDAHAPETAEPASQAPHDAAARMYEYATRHPDAAIWDGRSTRSGTITYVDDVWIEQYVGQQRWIAYRQADLGRPGFVLGDQVRIGTRAGGIAIEAVGANRLPREARAPHEIVRSGMTIVRLSPIAADERDSSAQTTADRYGATLQSDERQARLTFAHGAQLVIERWCAPDLDARIAALVVEPIAGAVRLETWIDSEHAVAALEAESALAYCAALFATADDALAIDDTGAVLRGEQLYDLAVRDETRAAAFGIAASAAQRAWPCGETWMSERTGVVDELVVFFRRTWRADFAAAALKRALDALADALARSDDPIIPTQGVIYSDDERGAPEGRQRLLSLTYETVEIDIRFLDAASAAADLAPLLSARQDVAALLGGDAACAVIIAFGNSGDDQESDRFFLEMRRADAVATALAAVLVRRGDCVASDAAGALYSAQEIVDLAVQRRGKAAASRTRAFV